MGRKLTHGNNVIGVHRLHTPVSGFISEVFCDKGVNMMSKRNSGQRNADAWPAMLFGLGSPPMVVLLCSLTSVTTK